MIPPVLVLSNSMSGTKEEAMLKTIALCLSGFLLVRCENPEPYNETNIEEVQETEIGVPYEFFETAEIEVNSNKYSLKIFFHESKEIEGIGDVVYPIKSTSHFQKEYFTIDGYGQFYNLPSKDEFLFAEVTITLDGEEIFSEKNLAIFWDSVLKLTDLIELLPYKPPFDEPHHILFLPQITLNLDSLDFGFHELMVVVILEEFGKIYSESRIFFTSESSDVCLEWSEWLEEKIPLSENVSQKIVWMKLFINDDDALSLIVRRQGIENVEMLLFKRNEDYWINVLNLNDKDYFSMFNYLKRDFTLIDGKSVIYITAEEVLNTDYLYDVDVFFNIQTQENKKSTKIAENLFADVSSKIILDEDGILSVFLFDDLNLLQRVILNEDYDVYKKEGIPFEFVNPSEFFGVGILNANLDENGGIHLIFYDPNLLYVNNVFGFWKEAIKIPFSPQIPSAMFSLRNNRLDLFLMDSNEFHDIMRLTMDYSGYITNFISVSKMDELKYIESIKKIDGKLTELSYPQYTQPGLFYDQVGRHYIGYTFNCEERYFVTNATGKYNTEMIKKLEFDECNNFEKFGDKGVSNRFSDTAIIVTPDNNTFYAYYDLANNNIHVLSKKCIKSISLLK